MQALVNTQLIYVRQARDHRLMSTPDEHGLLPLHRAVCDNVIFGSIKLLVKGNPSAVQAPDNNGALPLHLACHHHESASVIEYLVGRDAATLQALDAEENTALHYACLGANRNDSAAA